MARPLFLVLTILVTARGQTPKVCETEDANGPVMGHWEFMNKVEQDKHTLFHLYGDPVAATGKRQFLVMAAMPKVGSGKYQLKVNGEKWGMTYFVVKGPGCIAYSDKHCFVDKQMFGDGHKDGANTPSSVGFMGFFGGPSWSSTNEYSIPADAVPGNMKIELEPCDYDTNRACALVKGTTCYLKRIHVCEMEKGKATKMRMEGITKDGSGQTACSPDQVQVLV